MNIRKLRSFVKSKNQDILQSNPRVALAMSGGIDSTALFYVFLEFAKKKIFSEFIILHVNFGLRGRESDGDQRFLEDLCSKNGITFKAMKVKKQKNEKAKLESIQIWARNIRHKWFKEFSEQGYLIATGHNQNDLAENVLFRMARGSSPENLAGMSRIDGHLWRPLIDISRKDIEQAMKTDKLKWREDITNKTKKYSRNKIRHEVIPVLESISSGSTEKIAALGNLLATMKAKKALESDNTSLSLMLGEVSEASRHKIEGIREFLRSATYGQKIDLGDGFSLTRDRTGSSQQAEFNAPLAIQHAANLDGYKTELILGPGDRFLTPNTAKYAEQNSHKKLNWIEIPSNPPVSRALAVNPPKSSDKVTFAELKSSFKFKDLMQKWNIRTEDRSWFSILDFGDGKSVLVKRSDFD